MMRLFDEEARSLSGTILHICMCNLPSCGVGRNHHRCPFVQPLHNFVQAELRRDIRGRLPAVHPSKIIEHISQVK